MSRKRVQLSLDVSPELYQTLNDVAHKLNEDLADVLLKAIVLMEVAAEAKKEGKHIWIADDRQNLETEIVGI